MERSEFTEACPGKLIKNLDGQLAFLPNPLPGRLQWTDRLVSVVSEAESALGRLGGLGHKFPRPERLTRLFLRREAELSSRIENTFAGVRTQLLFKFVPAVNEKSPDAQEVENNFSAIEFGLKAIAKRPISQYLIKQMHQMLMQDVRGQDKFSGQYRNVQAHIGRTNLIEEARFVPPPAHAVPECMERLARFIQGDQAVPRIAKLAMIHYQFECIHPFTDGNGRIGRVLILLLMCRMGMLPLPLFNPSAYLERNRREYYDLLLDVSQRGAWEEWIEFFSRGITEECGDTSRRIERLEHLRRSYQEKVSQSRSSAKLTRLVDELFARPRLRLEDVQRTLDVWPASAQRFVDKLLALKILREVTGGQRNRIYLADKIVEAFSTGKAGS